MHVKTAKRYSQFSLGFLMITAGFLLGREAAQAAGQDAGLSALLMRQTQEFSDAGQTGNAAVMDRYLDPQVVFTNETGEIANKQDLLEGVTPTPPGSNPARIAVTHWMLRQQGDVATATFIDELTRRFQNQTLVLRFQSTETWAKRKNGWRMIASHTMNVQRDPAAISLTSSELDDYVGAYQLDPTYLVKIARTGGDLTASTNGAPPVPLKVEIKDVLFVPGTPNARRLFQRDPAGKITGYISRRDGNDLLVMKLT